MSEKDKLPIIEPDKCKDKKCDVVIARQDAEIAAEFKLKPIVGSERAHMECCGEPEILCKPDPSGCGIEIVVLQKVKIKIPVKLGVKAEPGEYKMKCSDCKCSSPRKE